MKVFVKIHYPDDWDAPPQIVGVYKSKPIHATNESIEEFELDE